jgi:hypothetical protein
MAKRKCDCTPEEWERQKAMSRERNRRYLAKGDPDVMAKRATAQAAYRERLATDPSYADTAEALKRKAVERTAAWQKKNPEKVKAHAKALRQRHPEKEVAKVQRRNAMKLQAIPAWANFAAIERHYANARYLTEITGHQHHVDHIIPLRGETVCGLHVENNLRAIPHFLNTRKGNSLPAGV